MSAEPENTGSAGFPAGSEPAGKNAGDPSLGSPTPKGVGPRTTHLGWYSRGYLPHFDQPGRVQALTFRLADSLPCDAAARIDEQLALLPAERRTGARAHLLAASLDRGLGSCPLANPDIAQIVEDALRHFDGERYRLLAWCVMPNHVHVLVETRPGHPVASLVQSWKGYTAFAINKRLGRSGPLWARDYHDRFIRDAAHLANALRYIEQNPVAAGLITRVEEWPFSSATA
jgi:putative transposase